MPNRAFIRFPEINIESTDYIDQVFLRLTAFSDNSDTPVNLRLGFVAETNPDAPVNYSELQSKDVIGWVSWTIEDGWINGTEYDSPYLTDLFRDVISQDGWASGNSVLLIIEDVSSSYKRGFSAYEYSFDECAKLYVRKYTRGDKFNPILFQETFNYDPSSDPYVMGYHGWSAVGDWGDRLLIDYDGSNGVVYGVDEAGSIVKAYYTQENPVYLFSQYLPWKITVKCQLLENTDQSDTAYVAVGTGVSGTNYLAIEVIKVDQAAPRWWIRGRGPDNNTDYDYFSWGLDALTFWLEIEFDGDETVTYRAKRDGQASWEWEESKSQPSYAVDIESYPYVGTVNGSGSDAKMGVDTYTVYQV